MPFAPADAGFADSLRAALPAATFRPVEPRYLEEPRGAHHGHAGLILAPATVDEVSTIVKAANAARVAVVPYGGGTGLVGGQVAENLTAPLILSFERMTAIRAVHTAESVLVAEAGATLAEIHAAAEEVNRLFPLSYASEGTARIGGALSVNSGGLNVLRYGTARDLCLGIEAVLPNGEILHGLKRLRKDATGYDLRNLLIGAEGTLGVITAASLRLFPRPPARATALLTVPSPAAALDLFARTGDVAGNAVSAFELISGQGPRMMIETDLGPLPGPDPFPDWAVLLELTPLGVPDPGAVMEALFLAAFEAGEVTDGLLAQSEAQADAFWAMRETIPLANRAVGAVASHDISLPLSEVAGFLDEVEAEIARIAPVRINAFGHLGDGNLHFNLFPRPGEAREAYADVAARLTRLVHDLVDERGGSFSAEHGVGRLKTDDLQRYGDPTRLAAMRAIKTAFDPNWIMNPGAVLPSSDLE
ncbi:MAG: FAD-binding oxidoreductase [Pseudomonadota bacterium]